MEWSRPECINFLQLPLLCPQSHLLPQHRTSNLTFFGGVFFRLPKAVNLQDLHAQLLIPEDLGIPIDAASWMSTSLDFFPPDNLDVLPTWIPFWSAVLFLAWSPQATFTEHRVCPPHCFQTQGFISPSRKPWWRTPSPSFPPVSQVPSQSIPMIFWFHQRLSIQHEMGHQTYAVTGVTNQMFCLLQQPRWSQKTQCPAGPQCKMKHKQMTFLQHVHLHKASVVPPCPVNMFCCTAPSTKLSGQIRGRQLKTADRGENHN